MSRQPLHEESIPFRAAAFHERPVKAGIDRGSSLTKIAFVPKDSPTHADTVQLRCLTFHNDHFIDALHVMKEQAQLPDQGQLHITGVGAATCRHKIKEIIGLDVVFVDEMMAICYGSFYLVNNASDIFHPVPEYKKWDVEVKFFDLLMKDKQAKTTKENFPALILHMGSGGGIFHVDEEGKVKVLSFIGFAGKCLMGMAHALIGTADYDELMELAEKGDATVADLTMGELVKDDPDSPYGRFPSDLPGFPFGKASEKSWDRSRCSREDLAASLVGHVVVGCVMSVFPVVNKTGVLKLYATGNFFRSEFVRKLLYEKLSVFACGYQMDLSIMRNGHQGAIGVMMMDAGSEKQK